MSPAPARKSAGRQRNFILGMFGNSRKVCLACRSEEFDEASYGYVCSLRGGPCAMTTSKSGIKSQNGEKLARSAQAPLVKLRVHRRGPACIVPQERSELQSLFGAFRSARGAIGQPTDVRGRQSSMVREKRGSQGIY
jgi:hypothetical protein